jgi:hypothetical protein
VGVVKFTFINPLQARVGNLERRLAELDGRAKQHGS